MFNPRRPPRLSYLSRLTLVVADGDGRWELDVQPDVLRVPNYLIFTPENVARIKAAGRKVY
jgi:hypothetical protein